MIKTSWRILRRALNRTWVVITLIVVVWLLAGLAFSIAEGKNVFEGLWWASVTGATVGYGDYFPITTGGRVVGTLFMVFSTVITAFFTAHVVAAVIEDKNKFTHSEQERVEAALWMIMVEMKLLPPESNELPPLAWFKKVGFKESADE